MARDGYNPLPLSHESPSSAAEEEMEMAFESDDEEQQDTIPLTQQHIPQRSVTVELAPNGPEAPAYDFERDYDYPPPGSPPPSAFSTALGNSNGVIPLPSSVPRRELGRQDPRPSFFRRAVGALLPQHYARVPTSEIDAAAIARGGGIENDGVFSNVLAKPTHPVAAEDGDGNVQVMPEDAQKDVPPTYDAAQADAVPPYWETTIHAPASGGADDLLIDGLPSGTIFSFAWNFLISISFQFVGFMLTYLLHTSHAAKYGSRAGLGVTLIQYGLYSQAAEAEVGFGGGSESDEAGETDLSGQAMRVVRRLSRKNWMASSDSSSSDPAQTKYVVSSARDWLSFLLMTIGWFLLLTSILGFARVKRWEHSIRAPTPAPSREDIEREREVRSRLQHVFGFGIEEEENQTQSSVRDSGIGTRNSNGNTGGGEPESASDVEIRRQLRASGFL
ncbi:hypothetical protein DFH11DRAFT_1572984 [Phellopilus nigrolimitatus]|nr:hypothetical protein DFH11DRAFT_1572984 [Phellopilus nigrolimitatus]